MKTCKMAFAENVEKQRFARRGAAGVEKGIGYFPCSLRKGSGHSAAGNPDEPQESDTMFGSDDDDDVGAL